MTKLAVIYYSATGHGTKMAEHIAQAGERAGELRSYEGSSRSQR